MRPAEREAHKRVWVSGVSMAERTGLITAAGPFGPSLMAAAGARPGCASRVIFEGQVGAQEEDPQSLIQFGSRPGNVVRVSSPGDSRSALILLAMLRRPGVAPGSGAIGRVPGGVDARYARRGGRSGWPSEREARVHGRVRSRGSGTCPWEAARRDGRAAFRCRARCLGRVGGGARIVSIHVRSRGRTSEVRLRKMQQFAGEIPGHWRGLTGDPLVACGGPQPGRCGRRRGLRGGRRGSPGRGRGARRRA